MALSAFLLALGALSLAIWAYLIGARDGFWRAEPRLEDCRVRLLPTSPEVVAIVPARNEAPSVGDALRSLLGQDYPGGFHVILVDDHSEDDTARVARAVAAGAMARTVEVISPPPLPPGWSGKLWAVAAGVRRAEEEFPGARYLLLTDADIAHGPESLARLVAKADSERLDLVSLMVRLSCQGFWDRLLVPPFVFFFRMLYPFAAVNEAGRKVAAAAGGCMLVRRRALDAAGGIEVVRDRLIDDVALARALKCRPGGGRIWLGLTEATVSLRPYAGLGGIWRMVARTADTQLGHSLTAMAGTVLAMAATFLAPPLVVLSAPWHGELGAASLAALPWLLMSAAMVPTLRLYRLSPVWGLALPLAALLYLAMSVDSAWRYRRGRGGQWKGRIGAPRPERGRPDTTG